MHPVPAERFMVGRIEMVDVGPLKGPCLYPHNGGPAVPLSELLSTYRGRNVTIDIKVKDNA